MNTKLLTAGVILAVLLGLFGTFRPAIVEKVIEKASFGALSGPDIISPYLRWGDLAHFATRISLAKATSTVCALQSPASTSTLVATGLSLTTGTSTAVTLRIATSTTAFATTTLHQTISLGSGVMGAFNYAPTTTVLQIMSPSQYIVWDAAGFIGADTTKFLGTCFAEWEVL